MKKIYRNFITQKDVEYLKKLNLHEDVSILDKNNKVIDSILNKLKEDFDFEVLQESYYKLEETPTTGHDWHKDTGSGDHMVWCQVGCSILLESDCDGGKTYYKEDDKVTEIDRDTFDLVAHSSDTLHKVDPPNGYRLVFLIFI